MKLEKLEKKAQKASQRAQKARDKLPVKRKLRLVHTFDNQSDRPKKKIMVEKTAKLEKESLVKKGVREISSMAASKVHEEISKVENENTSVEATHAAEQRVESTVRYVNRHKKTKQQKARHKVKKLEKKELKTNTKYQYRKFLNENPQYDKKKIKRRMQKKRIRQEFASKLKNPARTMQTIAADLKDIIRKKKGAMIGVGAVGLLFLIVASSLGSCATMFMGAGTNTVTCSYTSPPYEIDRTEEKYMELESDLQETIDHVERDHPGYDEYRYNIGTIGHDPFALISYLSAKNTSFTYHGVSTQLTDIFQEMYQLKFRHVQETRRRTEQRTGTRTIHHQDGTTTTESYQYEVEVEYTVEILETTLEVKNMDQIAGEKLTDDQKSLYQVYGITHGGLQQFVSPLDLYWYNYVSSYHGNRKNPNTGTEEYHDGIDIAVPDGKKVYSGMDSTVSETGNDTYYGKYICLSDGRGYLIKYAHLSEVSVTNGQTVTKGTEIGKTGHSGTCTEPHLHLQLSYNGCSYNPIFYFDAESATLYGEGQGNSQTEVTPPAHYDDETVRKLMDEAGKYVGKAYVWGGSDPVMGFDCSGFVCWSVTQSGMKNLPRTSAQGIYNQCTPISQSEAKAGDLIFFTRTYNSGTPVTHVGIYCGNGVMLHCGDPIKYSNINTPYWTNHFYGFGRLN